MYAVQSLLFQANQGKPWRTFTGGSLAVFDSQVEWSMASHLDIFMPSLASASSA
jgi:hypothetical protein